MNKKIILATSLVSLLSPIVCLAAAATVPFPGIILDINILISAIFGVIWPLFAAFAVIMFIYAGFLFLNASGDPGKVGEARQAVLWGAIGVGVGLLAWSIPFIVKTLIGV